MDYQSFLDKKYWDRHHYLIYFIDCLADILVKADELHLSTIKFDFKDKNEGKSFKHSDDIFEWMEQHGYHEQALDSFTRHMFFSLLKDFRFYMYESISCAARGKITVAYTLLRKPLKESFVYIEWLLANNNEFYSTFLSHDAKEYDVTNSRKFNKAKLSELMKEASDKTYMGNAIIGDGFIYDLRFNHEEEISLERIWNKTMHLVTNRKTYKTEKTNLNFIFSDSENWNEFINYYYLVVPQICAYILEVCETLFIKMVDVDNYSLMFNRALRFAKYSLYINDKQLKKQLKQGLIELVGIGKKSGIYFYIPCESCDGGYEVKKSSCNKLENDWFVTCEKCGGEINLCRYHININIRQKGTSVNNFL